jgi:hypothetical protein
MADHWPAACRAQGWNDKDRALRIEVFSRILGRPIASASEIDERGDYDVIKRELGTLADSLDAAMDSDAEAAARRLRAKIRGELMPCLALYTGGMDGAERYVATLIRGVVHRGRGGEQRGLDDLSAEPRFRTVNGAAREIPSELDQLVMTISARLNGKTGLRNKAGHTLHEMRTLAGLSCGCAACARGAALVSPVDAGVEEPF